MSLLPYSHCTSPEPRIQCPGFSHSLSPLVPSLFPHCLLSQDVCGGHFLYTDISPQLFPAVSVISVSDNRMAIHSPHPLRPQTWLLLHLQPGQRDSQLGFSPLKAMPSFLC